MRTSEEIYHRVRWDPRFDPARFTFGVSRREGGVKRVALATFVPGGDIPWHRIMFVEADGQIVWDRESGVDRIDASRAGRVTRERRLRAPSFRACVPHRWDERAQAWRPAPEPSAELTASGPSAIRVLTWNTLWDRYDADRIDTAARRPLLLDVLRARHRAGDADVIALQEVEGPLLAVLAREEWVRAGYTFWANPGKAAVDDDGLVLLSRLPVFEAARCVLGPYKAALLMTVAGPAGPLVVATTHLTSNHTPNAQSRRMAELAELAAAFGGIDADLVVMGDFNDSTGEPAAALGLADAWTEARGGHDEAATFDPGLNPLAAVSSLTGKAGRLDRVLFRARGGGVRAAAASLVGDVPDERGLFPSDHFGVTATLTQSDTAGPGQQAGLFAPPTARTALAWIPPRELWPTVNGLRERYDPQVERWPPHVNVLFGFVPEHEFERAAPLLAEAAARVAPFTARLAGVETFGHRDSATVWLDPAAAGSEPWTALHAEFQKHFPDCSGREDGCTPHLTLGRAADPERVAVSCAAALPAMTAEVGKLALLSRRGDEPMGVRAEVELGTGMVTWLDEPMPPAEHPPATDSASAQRIVERIQAALDDAALHLVGSRRMGCALPGADVDLVTDFPGAVDLGEIGRRLVRALPEATHVRQVVGARVPGLRLDVGGLGVDLVVVPSGSPAYAEAAAIALSALTDAEAVLDVVRADPATFAQLARQVKTWAKARGLDSAPFGGLPGLAWAVLAARTVARGTDVTVAGFFAQWAAWDWRRPVALDGAAGEPTPEPVRVLTPTAPVRSCTAQVGPAARDLLVEELYRGWELTQTDQPFEEISRRLCEPPPLHRRHAAWALVTIEALPGKDLDDALGRVRGRMRALILQLEAASSSAAIHAWPRPLSADAHEVRYAIGLGRTPLDRRELAEIAESWAKGMRGVRVEWREGGEVGSLTAVGVFER
ncbi:DUF504 domain-containing protein [Actinospica sp. MGRD01-02]|uniref:DUF504 domain-containing protein n=1 Tax=Actinospica acidithermotolerans TaxID=2828514 RepID=A0A941E3I6_9ACTN|nr:poly(A) polymerase [Actinospica acidithermotolerans]MBR7825530.1 DUF504 domain-containing protein [Actinospica acidithermotolerans]